MARGMFSGARIEQEPNWELSGKYRYISGSDLYIWVIISGKDKNTVREVLDSDSVSRFKGALK